MKNRLKSIFAGTLLLLTSIGVAPRAHAWGQKGHEMVAALAMKQLTPEARRNVLNILGTTTPEAAATWMDDIKGNHSYDHMRAWHYINIEKGATYQPSDNDIIHALEQTTQQLRNVRAMSPKERKEAVMVLFHLLGDLHQPLHDGYGSDKGGNTVQVRYNNRGTNLHHIWDTDLIDGSDITLADLEKSPMPSKSELGKTGDYLSFMNQSRALLPQVYAFSGRTIDKTYIRNNAELARHQLLLAGGRLAAVLNQLLGTVNIPATAVAPTSATGTLSPEAAEAHIGETATVCGLIAGTKYVRGGKKAPTFLNMGAPYPDSPFTVVIFKDDRKNFPYRPEKKLNGKTICVTGIIKSYRGKPQIIATSPDQIQIQ